MPVDVKPGIVKQSLLEVRQSAVSEIYNLAAAGTYKMMVMLRRSSHHVTAASIRRVYTAHQIQIAQQAQRSVHRNQSDVGVAQAGLLIYRLWRQMIVTASDNLEHSVALRGELMLVLPENSCDPVCC